MQEHACYVRPLEWVASPIQTLVRCSPGPKSEQLCLCIRQAVRLTHGPQ